MDSKTERSRSSAAIARCGSAARSAVTAPASSDATNTLLTNTDRGGVSGAPGSRPAAPAAVGRERGGVKRGGALRRHAHQNVKWLSAHARTAEAQGTGECRDLRAP